MIEPLFCAKLRYGLELIVDILHKDKGEDLALQALHSLHRGAMKAALGISHRKHPSDEELYRRTGQQPIRLMAQAATALMAWKCGRDWRNHPLTGGKVIEHYSGRNTRQSTLRSLPPQPIRGILTYRLVELWEKLPQKAKEEQDYSSAKKIIKSWLSEEPSLTL